jgi:hypothetical protein
MATSTVSRPHTKAWATFAKNLHSITHMVALGRREIAFMQTESTRLKTSLTRERTKLERLMTSEGESPELVKLPVKRTLDQLTRYLDRFTETEKGFKRLETATLWQVVMLVTCVEAYLQDVLAIAASVDKTLMNDSQQVARYADVISATSLDELAGELRTR